VTVNSTVTFRSETKI